MSAFSNSRANSEQFSRATQSLIWLEHRHKKCVTGCGAQIKAKWIVQQDGLCAACFKARAEP